MIAEPVPVRRTREIEEPTNRYLIHPMSRALVTRLARWGVSPNAVSVVGLGFGAGAALAYAGYERWPMPLLGFGLMIGWHVLDGADGQLARLTGRTSEVGKVLDGLCDHGTFALVYLSLAWASAQALGPWAWGAAVLAGLSHLAQAGAYEFQRQSYDFWVHGKRAARVPTPEAFRRELQGRRGWARAFGRVHLRYLQMQRAVTAGEEPLRARLEAALREPEGAARVAAAYRAVNLRGVRRWNLLCSNYRTLAIFAACLAGSPVFFFAFEAVVLNAVFAALVRMQRRHDRALLARL